MTFWRSKKKKSHQPAFLRRLGVEGFPLGGWREEREVQPGVGNSDQALDQGPPLGERASMGFYSEGNKISPLCRSHLTGHPDRDQPANPVRVTKSM